MSAMSAETPTITAYPDGPLIVRGDVVVRTPDGEEIRSRRRVLALCRCGVSAIKPWCDGTHRIIGFTTEPGAPS